MHGQMYVEVLTPDLVQQPYPLVLIHGRGQTATNWLTTPDGRPGWADWFTDHGWVTVLIDQPARGRSAWHREMDGDAASLSTARAEVMFTAPARSALWPQACRHTQWPGGADGGRPGDPVFDQFYASQVASADRHVTEAAMRTAGAALLDRIGPAILLGHSNGGAALWLIADERPALVKGLVAVEPFGPPVQDGPRGSGSDRPWGLTITPLTYEPPITSEAPLLFELQPAPDEPDLLPCWSQAGQPRRLPNLAGTPTLIVTGEASYHAQYDHCTARYLSQAGVSNTFVRLEDHGISGNGHLMMLEMNNTDSARLIHDWLIANAAASVPWGL